MRYRIQSFSYVRRAYLPGLKHSVLIGPATYNSRTLHSTSLDCEGDSRGALRLIQGLSAPSSQLHLHPRNPPNNAIRSIKNRPDFDEAGGVSQFFVA
jgi:hypothetical protein